MNPDSALHPIYKDVLQAEEENKEARELLLSYSVEFGFRAMQDGLHSKVLPVY
jgi:hypothetical protein